MVCRIVIGQHEAFDSHKVKNSSEAVQLIIYMYITD